MKNKKTLIVLTVIIVLLSSAACLTGIFSSGGPGQYNFKSIFGETVKIYGKGLYRYNSVSVTAQGIAQDIVTLFLGIPLLVVSFIFALKGSLKGKLLYTGTMGYFLYTYISYTFLWVYNPFFLCYAALMSASFFAFVMMMMSFDITALPSHFSEKANVKLLGGFQIFLACVIF